MKYRIRKLTALLMALLMVLNMAPISAIADDVTDIGGSQGLRAGTPAETRWDESPGNSNFSFLVQGDDSIDLTGKGYYLVVSAPGGGYKAHEINKPGYYKFVAAESSFAIMKHASGEGEAATQGGGNDVFVCWPDQNDASGSYGTISGSFVRNSSGGTATITESSSPSSFGVLLDFGTSTGSVTSGKYYAYLTAHNIYGEEYSYLLELSGEGQKVFIPTTANWFNNKTWSEDWINYSIQIMTPKSGKTLNPGGNPKPDQNDYISLSTIGRYTFTTDNLVTIERTNEGVRAELVLHMTEPEYDNTALTPGAVLGAAVDYGIVANEYVQSGHTETNFAVNTFNHAGQAEIDIDGSGTGAIPFYVGSITTKLLINQNTSVDVDIYCPDDQYGRVEKHPNYHKELIHVSKTSDEVRTYVGSLVSYARGHANTYKNKTTITPTSNEIDTTDFPNGTTIYINCANFTNGDTTELSELKIKKLEGQTLVFNMSGTTAKVNQFTVSALNPTTGAWRSTDSSTSALNGDPAKNQLVDDLILEHIVFNAYNATSLHLSTASGLFLAPSASSVSQTNGAGWIVANETNGKVDTSSEWHFYRHERPYQSVGSKGMKIRKVLEDVQTGSSVGLNGKTFSFKLYEANEPTYTYLSGWSWSKKSETPVDTTTTGTDGVAYFKKLTKTNSDIPSGTGTFYYIIEEEVPSTASSYTENTASYPFSYTYMADDGIRYTVSAIHLKVVATDDGNGNVNFAMYTVDNNGTQHALSETNACFDIGEAINKSAHGQANVNGKKLISGDTYDLRRAREISQKYSFTISPITSGAPMPATTTVSSTPAWVSGILIDVQYNNTFSFGPIDFKLDDLTYSNGQYQPTTFEYQITETGELPGIVNDTDTHTVKITVSVDESNKGKLKTEVKYYKNGSQVDEATVQFNNKKDIGDLELLKQVEGTDNKEKEFYFEVTLKTKDPRSSNVNGEYTTELTDKDGNATYGTITFTDGKATVTLKADEKVVIKDIPKDYKYTIEEKTIPDGYECISHDGNKTASDIKIKNGTNTVTFRNKYTATGSTTFSGSKSITGRSFKQGDKATIKVTALTAGAPMPDPDYVVVEADSGNKVYYSFGPINYDRSHIPEGKTSQTYEYKVTEESFEMGGASKPNPETIYIVRVTITDNGNGTLQVDKSSNATALNFVNSYSAEGSLVLSGRKTITNKPDTMDLSGFKFTVKEGDDVVATGTSDTDGKITFTAISYSLDDRGTTHTYVVSEDADTKDGVTNTTSTNTVKVTVNDKGNGELEAVATDDSPVAINAVNFENAYDAKGKATVEVAKHLEGRELTSEDEFRFTLSAVSAGATLQDESLADIDTDLLTITNGADGVAVYFPDLYYTLSQKNAEYIYKIVEEEFNITDVSRDTDNGPDVIYVKVKVGDDNGDGTLADATVTYWKDEDCTIELKKSEFVNKYSSLIEVPLEAKKEMQGRKLGDNDFSFTLTNKKETENQNTFPITVNQRKGNHGEQVVFDVLRFAVYPTKQQVEEEGYIDITNLLDENHQFVLKLELAEDISSLENSVFPVKPIPEKFDVAGNEITKVAYDVTITLEHNIKTGKLSASVSPDKVDDLLFINKVLYLKKVDEEGTAIAGAKFEIVDKEGNAQIFEFETKDDDQNTENVDESLIELEHLAINKYYILREINAPDDYILTKDTVFHINEKGEIEFSEINPQVRKAEFKDSEGIAIEAIQVENKPASKPEFEKKIMDINDSTGDVSKWQDSADYDIGDVIPFKLTATLADNVTDYRYYKIIFHDEMEESLEFCKDSIQVKLFTKDNQPMEEPEIKQGDGYYADSLHSFDQMFDWGDKTTRISDTRLNGARVELYFTAKLTGDKVKFGKEGNVNTAWLEYSSSPRVNDNGDQSTETKETEKDSVIAFTYKVVVNKVDEDGKALTGAKFKLEKKIKDSENKVIAQAEAEPGATFTFAGLDDGDYVLTETYVPAGMKAIDPIEFTVTAEHNVEWKVEENQDRMEILTELTGNVTTGELKLDADKEKLTALTGDVKNEEAEKPKFEKKIQDTNDTTGKTSGWQDSADYDISDAVPYKLTATLADNVTDYLKYHITFHDTMEDGLTFKGIDKVTVNGTEVDAADYDLTFKDHSFDLTLTWTGENGKKIADIDLNKAEVEVYFTAELNEDAARGNQGNVNTAKLIYSCSPNVDELDKTEETKEDSVIAFTYDVVVNKVDKDGKALTGAEFKLEKKLADNTLEEIKRLTVKENVFTFSGLDDGDYVLTETRVPANMKAIDPIEFTVTAEHNVEWKVEENQDRLEILTDLTGNVTTGKLKLAADDDLTSLTGDVKNEEAEKPKFDKKIQDTNDTTGKTSGWQDSADYDIGDAIPYKLTANLADNVTDYLQYHITFHDSMDEGLTFKGIDKVTVNGAEVAAADYDLTSKDHSFDLTLTWAGENGKKIADTDLNKAAVEVYFTAELNENAVLGNQGNVNTAKLIYSCSPNADELDKTEETKEDSVIAFTYEVVVNKIDEDGKALTGAEFKLEKKLTDGTLKLLDVVKAESGATFTFKGLDDGDYVLTETKVPDGRLSIDPIEFTVTAEHNIEWKVEENQDRLEILTGLTGNVTTGELKLEAEEKLTGLIGDVVNTKTHVKVQKVDVNDQHELEGAKIQIIDEEGTVVFEFTSGEEATDIEGLKTGVTYTLHEEVAPNGYLTRSDTTFTIDEKGNVTGSATIDVDEEGNVVLLVEDQMKKVSATVRKVWDDDEDRDGLRPNSITVSLLQNGVVYKSVPLNAANNWTSMVKDLPAVDSECNDYTYTWAEPVATEGYTMTSIKTVGTLTTLTNTHGQAETEVKVRKVWADNDNAAQKRPASITVQLYADGQVSGTPITLDASNNWSGSWTKLTKNEKGTEIKYTVAETTIPEGYVATITGNASTGYVITNTYDTGKLVIEKEFDIEPWEFEGPDDSPMDIPVIKTWNDNGNKDGNRPEAVTVRLLADGTEVANAQLTEANNWRYTFTGLPRLTEEKEKISYTITEDPVEWYEAEIHGFNIRNNYKPVLTSVSVRKEWEDNNNAQNLRPTSIVMTLSNGMTVVLDANNNWTATIDNLPTRVNGQPVTYTWTEQTVLNYNLVDVVTEGALTTFTNRVWVRPTTTTTGGGTPKRTGDTVTFEEYETPLGVEIVINHVGDCFD